MIDNNGNIDDLFNDIAAKTIKKYRIQKGLSLEDVVKKMGNQITRQSLYKYENNHARMKNSIFLDICKALNVDASEIFYEINEEVLNIASKQSKMLNAPIDIPLANKKTGEITYTKVFANEDMMNKYFNQDNKNSFDELELLFDKHKDILTDDDKEYIKFIIEKRKKEIDKELGE